MSKQYLICGWFEYCPITPTHLMNQKFTFSIFFYIWHFSLLLNVYTTPTLNISVIGISRAPKKIKKHFFNYLLLSFSIYCKLISFFWFKFNPCNLITIIIVLLFMLLNVVVLVVVVHLSSISTLMYGISRRHDTIMKLQFNVGAWYILS